MKELLAPLMDSVIGVVLVANTPAYLFKHLREVLADVSREISFDWIVGELRDALAAPSSEIERIAYLYALFVLMTYRPHSAIQRELKRISDSGIRWMADLVMLYKQTAVVSKLIEVSGEQPPTISVNPKYRVADGSNNFRPPVEIS